MKQIVAGIMARQVIDKARWLMRNNRCHTPCTCTVLVFNLRPSACTVQQEPKQLLGCWLEFPFQVKAGVF